jgi:hypothetical protein
VYRGNCQLRGKSSKKYIVCDLKEWSIKEMEVKNKIINKIKNEGPNRPQI